VFVGLAFAGSIRAIDSCLVHLILPHTDVQADLVRWQSVGMLMIGQIA
jgi:hypothetical protein